MKGLLIPFRLPSFSRAPGDEYDKGYFLKLVDDIRQMARTLASRVQVQVQDDDVVTVTSADSPYDIPATARVVLVDASGGAVVVNRPLASLQRNRPIAVVKVDASGNTVTDTAQGGDSINGTGSRVLSSQYSGHDAYSDGATSWVIVP